MLQRAVSRPDSPSMACAGETRSFLLAVDGSRRQTSAARKLPPEPVPPVDAAALRAEKAAAWARYVEWATDGKGDSEEDIAAAARELDFDAE